MEQLLVHLVVVLVAQHDHDDLRMPKNAVWRGHHVAQELGLDFIVVLLILKLDEVGILHLDLEHRACLSEGIVDVVGSLEV